jgi:hypothetical protein
VSITTTYDIYSLKPWNGQWDKKLNENELLSEPPGTKWGEVSKRKMRRDLLGNAVAMTRWIEFWRDDDYPILWTLKFQGGELRLYDDWLSRAEQVWGPDNKLVPWYGQKWKLATETEGEDGTGFINWRLTFAGLVRDGSREGAGRYRHARQHFQEALAKRNAALEGERGERGDSPRGNGGARTGDGAPPVKSADEYGASASLDDDIPF